MTAGKANAADVAFFVLWLALVLVPIFSEIKLGSIVELKQRIEDAKEDVKRDVRQDLAELRLEVRNAVDVRTNISPQINFPIPPRDEQLPILEQTIRTAIAEALGPRRAEPPAIPIVPLAGVSDDVKLLFETRYGIEVALRRIAEAYGIEAEGRRPVSGPRLAQLLVQQELVPLSLLGPIREVYSVCSPAIHGVPVTKAQVDFVRDVGPSLITALDTHRGRVLSPGPIGH